MISRIVRILKKIFYGRKIITPVYIPLLSGKLLDNKVALITGGTRGIGYAIAKSYIDNGATVCITGRSKESVECACAQLKNATSSESIIGIAMDISEPNLEEPFNEILDALKEKGFSPHIDILVNNAGINMGGFFGNVTSDIIDNVFATNLRGVFLLSQIVARHMKESNIKGNILNIASSSSLRPAAWPYSLSKWGIRGLTLGMAKTLISDGIIVNGLAPGRTATSMQNKSEDSGLELESSLIGRMIDPMEIANMATILVSSLGRTIVGDIVYMTAGDGVITVDDINYEFKQK